MLNVERGTLADFCFTTRGDTLYAISLVRPCEQMRVKFLGSDSLHVSREISSIQLPGVDRDLQWSRGAIGLVV